MRMLLVALVALPAYGQAMSDRNFVRQASSAGLYEVKAAQLALDKSRDDQVKGIARHMLEDHQAANDKLKRLALDQGITLSPQLLPEQQQLLDKLQAMSGRDFDHAYLSQQKNAHQQAIDLFQKEAAMGKDPALKSFAQETLPTLRMHAQMVNRTTFKM